MKASKSHFAPGAPPISIFLALPCVSDLQATKPVCHKLDVNIRFENTSTIKTMSVKNKTTVSSGAIVYKITCKDCELVHIGEKVRIKTHVLRMYAIRI